MYANAAVYDNHPNCIRQAFACPRLRRRSVIPDVTFSRYSSSLDRSLWGVFIADLYARSARLISVNTLLDPDRKRTRSVVYVVNVQFVWIVLERLGCFYSCAIQVISQPALVPGSQIQNEHRL